MELIGLLAILFLFVLTFISQGLWLGTVLLILAAIAFVGGVVLTVRSKSGLAGLAYLVLGFKVGGVLVVVGAVLCFAKLLAQYNLL